MDPSADGLQQSPPAAEASAASPSPLETGGATSVNQLLVQKSRTKTATVKICDAPVGKKMKTSWVWQVMQEFAPPINNKNVRCIVMVLKNGVQKQCGALQRWVPNAGTKGLMNHEERQHPGEFARLKLLSVRGDEAKPEIQEVVGECCALSQGVFCSLVFFALAWLVFGFG